MSKPRKPFPHDATPDVHDFSSPPQNVKEQINMYGTYNVQRNTDTENVFPLIGHGLPKQWENMHLDKYDAEKQ